MSIYLCPPRVVCRAYPTRASAYNPSQACTPDTLIYCPKYSLARGKRSFYAHPKVGEIKYPHASDRAAGYARPSGRCTMPGICVFDIFFALWQRLSPAGDTFRYNIQREGVTTDPKYGTKRRVHLVPCRKDRLAASVHIY